MDDRLWEAAEFVCEWDDGDTRWKLLQVQQDTPDDDDEEWEPTIDDEEHGSLMILGINAKTNVRYHEVMLYHPRTSYAHSTTPDDWNTVANALRSAPEEAKQLVCEVIGRERFAAL